MLTEQTLRKLNEMKLFGMARSFETRHQRTDHQDLSQDDFLGLLVDDEYLYRQNLRLTRLLQCAKFKMPQATLEDMDYRQPRGLIKNKVVNLQNADWIDKFQNILITGPTGVGKSYLACAFGHFACRQGYSTLYYRWPRLLGDILAARGEGNYLSHLSKLKRARLLIVDDFGLNAVTETERKDFLEIIEDRYAAGSTIITSQLPVSKWHDYLGEPTIADAVCDRLLHVAHTFELKGASMRKPSKN